MGTHRAGPGDLESLAERIRELAKPRPIYTPASVHKVHRLGYDWTGWLSDSMPFPPSTEDAIRACSAAWQGDGLVVSQVRLHRDRAQILFEAQPAISPVLCCQRVKGRLEHALRGAGTPVKFSRKIAFRSLGENTDAIVEGYLRKQVRKEGFIDPRYVARLSAYTIEDDDISLAEPEETGSGRYWYGLHLVVVVAGRQPIRQYARMEKLRDACGAIARKKGCGLKAVSVMPDHIHLALKGNIALSPEEIALGFLNNLAFVMGYNRVWKDEYYVGTFSQYGLQSIRQLIKRLARHPVDGVE